jgi:hypothetical protein
MNKPLKEIWLSHHSVEPWSDVSGWASYLSEVEAILETKLIRLDTHDPIRRKVTTLSEAGEYICDFGEKEDSRWLFAKFDNREIDCAIHHHKQPRHLQGQFPNSLKWNFSQKYLAEKGNEKRLKTLFRWGNQYLSTFFAYGDTKEHLTGKNKLRGSGAISLQAELPGISWLNYFNDAYVNFFGREKFNTFPEVIGEKYGGITTCLGAMPFDVPGHLREELAVVLGRESFINPADILNKPIGKYALSYEQLRARSAVTV